MDATHPYFSAPILARLCHPEGWRIVSSHCPPDVTPIEHPAHQRWLVEHSHSHAHLELLFFLDGAGCHSHQGLVYPCAPGLVFFFDSFEGHDQNCPPAAPDADHLWVAITREHAIARQVAVRNGKVAFAERSLLLARSDPRVSSAFMLLDLVASPPLVRRLKIVTALAALLTGIIETGYAASDEEDPRHLQQRIVATVQQHIRDTAGRGATLDHLARLAGFSKFHFLRIFKAHTGKSVHQYINECRRARVRQLLRDGASKKAISHALGFSCPAAFSRWHRQACTQPDTW
jgi:AraC-like DNA-binding protein